MPILELLHLVALLPKLFDVIVMSKEQNMFGSCICVYYITIETVSHNSANGSNVYAFMLEASKVFESQLL